ncbi:putative protoheme IX farnesyltransferase [Phytophthora infestans]|uniref:Putative protoheme IX farnesyltransferase n=1 Tax=Phytophthora infestans TaxID=4787 RepID=A0A8S9TLL0_PHYIN|nr:putative protoheme IX farnesyltransferase [Phytophthora infestans]
MLSIGFVRSKLDPCLYFCRHEGKLWLLGLYVEAVLVTSGSDEGVMDKLNQRFDIRDLGEADNCQHYSSR